MPSREETAVKTLVIVAADLPAEEAGKTPRVLVDVLLPRVQEVRETQSTSGNQLDYVRRFVDANFPRPWRLSSTTQDVGGNKLRVTVDTYRPFLNLDTDISNL